MSQKDVIFDKSIILNKTENANQPFGTAGQIRFNRSKYKFEGYHCYPNSNAGADIFGNKWRPLTQDVASTSKLGIVRVGSNLNMQASTGILSSVAAGVSRIYQCVITVSPIDGAADYQSINEAISHAIGTPTYSPPYTDGFLTSNIGGTGIASPPSTLYPFVIQLGPGQYSESSNQIILPDYVSLRGEDNYNSVITQNAGSNVENSYLFTNNGQGIMIKVGENCELKNLVINLSDTISSNTSGAIYSFNKSNVVIDNCIIKNSNTINTSGSILGIYIDGGYNNSITNNKIIFNTSSLTNFISSIYLYNSIVKIINNTITIVTTNTTNTFTIFIYRCLGIETINDKVYIENLVLSNNNSNSLNQNAGIILLNSPIIIKNSDIEVLNNNSTNNNETLNAGIYIASETPYFLPPYSGITSNVFVFTTTKVEVNSFPISTTQFRNTINSSNISIVNFLTQNYEQGQYISITGSSLNDGVYKIASVPTSNTMILENGYNLVNENSILENNNVTIKALYDINIYNTKINASSNTILNTFGGNNHIVNLNNVVTEGGPYNINPSYVTYTNYKTITVGKANCDYTSLYNAMNSISDSSSNTRYLIKIQSGIYYEVTYIVCKEYVDIEGNGKNNTILKFSQSAETSNIPTLATTCCVICSNMSIRNLSILNTNSNYVIGQTTSTLLWNPNPIYNITLENISIDGTSDSVYNTGLFFSGGSNIKLNNVEIYLGDVEETTDNVAINNIAIYNELVQNCTMNNITINVDNVKSINNYAIYFKDSECDIYNPIISSLSGGQKSIGIFTEYTGVTSKQLIQIYNGQIRVFNSGIEYSIYADNNYTIVCNGVHFLGETFANYVYSRIYCNGCYNIPDYNEQTPIQSLNSRGQNEQSKNTITLGDTADNRNSTGNDNVLIGVNSGNYFDSASYNTFVGSNTGKLVNVGNNNTLLGSYAGTSLRYGSQNTVTGSNAAISLVGGSDNVIHGYNSGMLLSYGNNNVIMGSSSGKNVTSGNLNVIIGESAGLNTTTSNNNTFIGGYSGLSNNNGYNNTYLGFQTGNSAVSSNNSVLIGNKAGYTNLSSNIVAIGNQAGYMNTESIKNTYIGHNSGYNNTTGVCNTFLGHYSGYSNTSSSSSYNVLIGNEAGYSMTTAERNILIGSTKSPSGTSNDAAGWSLTTGTDNIHIGTNSGANSISTINNVLIGSDVGTSITTASNNVLIGKNTGNAINSLGTNIIIGSESGTTTSIGNALIVGQHAGVGYTGNFAYALGHNAGKNTQGDYNMFLGYNSGGGPSISSKTGSYNLAIGPYSGFYLSTGSRNVLIGSGNSLKSVGIVISSGSDNTLLGYAAGSQIQEGNNNTLIGSNAGANITIGANNLILGYNSAFNLNQGSNNVSLGPYAGFNLETGSGNIFSGYQAGYNTKNGEYNINIGYQSGYSGSNINYANNIHIGYQSGYSSTAANNLFLGYKAGWKNTLGANNICIGLNSGQGNNLNNRQIGGNNVFIGTNTGQTNDNGNNNIFLGSQSGKNNTNGSRNIYIGENTGLNSVLSHNIFIGTTSDPTKGIGYNSSSLGGFTGNKNLFVGHDVGIENTTGTGNIFLGDNAGSNNTTGSQNIYLGTYAGNLADTNTADNNIAIGYYAGYSNTIGKENILIGKEAGRFVTESNQIFIGSQAGASTTTGNNNIFIGYSAGASIVTDSRNVVIGYNAMSTGISSNCVIIGNEAGRTNNGTNNIFIGNLSGTQNNLGFDNTFIGSATGGNNDIGNGNIFMGKAAGYTNGNGENNTFMGVESGYNNSSGSANVFMGYQSGAFNLYGNKNIVMGYQSGFYNQSDNNTFLGFRTGYNTDNFSLGPYGNHENNTYIGTLVGQLNNGYNNFFLGYETVDNTTNLAAITNYHDKFAIYNNKVSGITNNTTSNCTILIGGDFTTGTVGIGTLIPDTYGAISETATKLVVIGKVKAYGYLPFTGSHEVIIDSSISDPKTKLIEGMCMTSTGVVDYQNINNSVVTVKPSLSLNDKAVYGVYSGYETVLNESNVLITTYYVNSLGEGGILVTNYSGEIQNGDYITTSPIRSDNSNVSAVSILGGYGSLQSDDILHSYTVAKCTQNVDWASLSTTITFNSVSYKYTMVSCTYHCG
jgi:hypothetical protein